MLSPTEPSNLVQASNLNPADGSDESAKQTRRGPGHPWVNHPTRWVHAAVVAVALVVILSGVAYASIPGKDGTIVGCYSKTTGNLRIIDPAKTVCTIHERTLSWTSASQMATSLSALQAADATLTAGLRSEVVRAVAAEAALVASLTSETSRATGAEISEASRALAAEATLLTTIDDEIAARKTADSAISSDLAAETSRATGAEAALLTALDNEIVARKTVDNILSTDLRVSNSIGIAGDVRTSWNNSDANSVDPMPRNCAVGQVVVSTGAYQWACQTIAIP